MRGVLAPVSPLASLATIGIVSSGGWSGWQAVALGLGWNLALVALGEGSLADLWRHELRKANIRHVPLLALSAELLEACKLEILLFEERLPSSSSSIWRAPTLKMVLGNSLARRSGSPFGWHHKPIPWQHSLCGGVSEAAGILHAVGRQPWQADIQLKRFPRRQLSSILSSTDGGRPVPAPDSAPWPPVVTTTRCPLGRLGVHGDGIFPISSTTIWVDIPDCLSRTGWVRRKLKINELLSIFDVPVDAQVSTLSTSPLLLETLPYRTPISVLRVVGERIKSILAVATGNIDLQENGYDVLKLPPLPQDEALAGGCFLNGPTASVKRKFSEDQSAPQGEALAGGCSVNGPTASAKRKFSEDQSVTLRKDINKKRNSDEQPLLSGENKKLKQGTAPKVLPLGNIKENGEAKAHATPNAPFVEAADVNSPDEAKAHATPNAPPKTPVNEDRPEDTKDKTNQASIDASKKAYAVATKADDAQVPTHLWNQRALRLEAQSLPNDTQVRALNLLRKRCLQFWKRTTVKELCKFLSSPDKLKSEKTIKRPLRNQLHITHKSRSRHQWSPTGKTSYISWWNSRPRTDKDSIVGLDCVRRIAGCSWWEWDGGSTPFFWRWTDEFRGSVRDGTRLWIHEGKLPKYKRPQRDISDVIMKKAMVQKLLKVKNRRYFEEGLVSALTLFFAVPKGALDIRMVYDGTASGLNEALWAPWFTLPITVESHLRVVEPGTYMADVDLGEMFLNFFLDERIRQHAGVDLTKYLPDLAKPGQSVWLRWSRCAMGLRPSPYCAVQTLAWLEEIIAGNPKDPLNVFRYDKVELNLPGSESYDPSMPWVHKLRLNDGRIAADLLIFVDDARPTGPSEEECWQATRRFASMCNHYGIQDAPRKRRPPSLNPGAWAGSVVHTDNGEVGVRVSQDKWEKTRRIIRRMWSEWELFSTCSSLGEEPKGIDRKRMESDRGFLIYVSQAYPALVPYLKGIHLTIDGWRPDRNEHGWKLRRQEIDALRREGGLDGYDHLDSPQFVHPVPRYGDDLRALSQLTDPLNPPKRMIRSKHVIHVEYGFGDASGKGFGSTITLNGVILWRAGQWRPSYEEESSNLRELENIVRALEEYYGESGERDVELFMFTDNYDTECAFFKGNSRSESLFELVLRLRLLEMHAGWKLHVVHIAGTRMIRQGSDGLSRGDLLSGVMGGKSILSFIPLHLSAVERSPKLKPWVESWWPDKSLEWLSHNNWFSIPRRGGHFVWSPPPAAADAALEQLCRTQLKRPHITSHIFISPRLMTSRWRKKLLKACTFYFYVPACFDIWDKSQHEPLMIAVCLPLSKHRPWNLRATQHVGELERSLRPVQQFHPHGSRNLLRQFLLTTRKLETLPRSMVCKMLRPDDMGQVPD